MSRRVARGFSWGEVHRLCERRVLAEPGAPAGYQRFREELQIDACMWRGALRPHLTCSDEARMPTVAAEELAGWRAARPFYSGAYVRAAGCAGPRARAPGWWRGPLS